MEVHRGKHTTNNNTFDNCFLSLKLLVS